MKSLPFFALMWGISAWSADNYWQVTLSEPFAHNDHHDEFWRTHKVGDKIEVYPACESRAKPFATAQADGQGGWKLSGQFGNLSAKLDAKDKLILKLKNQNFGEGQRIARVATCEHGIPTAVRNIHPKGERSFAALADGAAHLQAAFDVTLPTLRDPPLTPLADIKDSLEYLPNGDAYACHTSKIAHSAVHPLQDVPTFGEIPDVWPGALLQGKLYAKGTFAPISAARSEGTTISITGLNLAPGSKYYTKVQGPTSRETVQEAIRKLLAQKVEGTEASSISFRTDIITNSDQLGYVLGVDGRFLNGIDKALPIDNSTGRSYVLATFKQIYYIVSFQDPEDPYSVFRDGESFTDKGNQIGADSPPLYVKSVAYGRLIFFLISSPFEADNVVTALNSARAGKDEGKITNHGKSYTYNEILDGSTISYIVMGGDAIPTLGEMGKVKGVRNSYDAIKTAITDTKLSQVTDFSKGVPVAYTLGYLTSLATASMGYSTAYNRTDCTTTPKRLTSFYLMLYCIDDVATVTLMDKNGKEQLLFQGSNGPKYVPIDPFIPEDQVKDNFNLRLRLYNAGGPSCLHFQLMRRRFGKVQDYTGLLGRYFVPVPDSAKEGFSWSPYPVTLLGGSWLIGNIVDFMITINRDTGEANVISGG